MVEPGTSPISLASKPIVLNYYVIVPPAER